MISMGRLPGHTSEVSVVSWAPNGAQLASSGPDRTIMLWYVRQHIGTPLGAVRAHESTVTGLSWSADGHLLASAAEDASIRLWQIIGGTQSFKVQAGPAWWGHDGAITALEWSPRSPFLASGGRDQMVRIWNAQGQTLTSWQAHGRGGISALAWSGDGSMIATGGADKQVSVWAVHNPAAPLVVFKDHADEIRHLRWSADGRLLASCAGKKNAQIIVWNVSTRQRLASLIGHKGEIVGLFWVGLWLVSVGSDSTVRIWNVARPAEAPSVAPLNAGGVPRIMDGAAANNQLAIGTSDMLVLIVAL